MRSGNLATHIGMLKIKVFLFRECDDASYFILKFQNLSWVPENYRK